MNLKYLIILLLIVSVSFSQTIQNESVVLDSVQVNTIFSEAKKEELNIKHVIVRVYKYEDKTGENYLVITERNNVRSNSEKEITNDFIKAFNFRKINGILKEVWSLKDFVIDEEESIWFWTKYIEVEDYDNDGFMEPIIIYGTSEPYDYDRMKIMVYHKGNKKGIRHQNADQDDARNTQVDSSIFSLPLAIRKRIKSLLITIEEKRHATFNSIYNNSEKRFQFEKEQLLAPHKKD